MPAKGKVSIKWQIVFSLISPLNIWAFYRIKKLRNYVLFVLAPSIVISLSLVLLGYYEYVFMDTFDNNTQSEPTPELPHYMTPIEPQVGKFDLVPYNVIGAIASIGFAILGVYMIIKWSRQWNENFN